MIPIEERLKMLDDLEKDLSRLIEKNTYIIDKECLEDYFEKFSQAIEDAKETEIAIYQKILDM